jgi:hypothetical protein
VLPVRIDFSTKLCVSLRAVLWRSNLLAYQALSLFTPDFLPAALLLITCGSNFTVRAAGLSKHSSLQGGCLS